MAAEVDGALRAAPGAVFLAPGCDARVAEEVISVSTHHEPPVVMYVQGVRKRSTTNLRDAADPGAVPCRIAVTTRCLQSDNDWRFLLGRLRRDGQSSLIVPAVEADVARRWGCRVERSLGALGQASS